MPKKSMRIISHSSSWSVRVFDPRAFVFGSGKWWPYLFHVNSMMSGFPEGRFVFKMAGYKLDVQVPNTWEKDFKKALANLVYWYHVIRTLEFSIFIFVLAVLPFVFTSALRSKLSFSRRNLVVCGSNYQQSMRGFLCWKDSYKLDVHDSNICKRF